MPETKPWSALDKKIRDEVQGILVLKMPFTEADCELFPKLKVYVRSLGEEGELICGQHITNGRRLRQT